MTNTDKDPHAELMRLADDYAKSTHNDGIHGLSGVSPITEGAAGRHADFARSLTDRLEQAEREIAALTLSVSNRDARIAELEEQLEAVGAGGVGAMVPEEPTQAMLRAATTYSAQCHATGEIPSGKGYYKAMRAAQPAPAVVEPVAIGFSPMWLAPIEGTPVLLYMPTSGEKFVVGQWHGSPNSLHGNWGDDEGNYYGHDPIAWISLSVLERLATTPPRSHQIAEPASQAPAQCTPCGGCGETDSNKRCLGCMHPFSAATKEQQGGAA